jgi:hypothetical protein
MRNHSISVIAASAALLAGCVATVTPPRIRVDVPAPEVYVPPPPRPVVSVYVEPPISEPDPIAVGWAPPPLLVESPPPPPFDAAVWVGGYWVWQGDWVWAHGHWVGPPRPNYAWVHPYYENRDGVVIFITGHWSPPGVAFVPPPPGIHLAVEVAAPGVAIGVRPVGPNGCFIPAPPGSRAGIIIPAPIGTAPAVVTGAPPVVSVGMRVTANVNNTSIVRNSTVVNNTTNNVTNVKNVTNITNVTIVAPAGVTANGQAVNASVPAQAHLAAAQPAVFKAQAPEPSSTKPIPAFVHGHPPAALPPAQAVNAPHSTSMHADTNQPKPQGSQGRAPQGPGSQQPPSVTSHDGRPPAGNNVADNAGKNANANNANGGGNKPALASNRPQANQSGAGGSQPKTVGSNHDLTAQPKARDVNHPGNPQLANSGGGKAGDAKHADQASPHAKDKPPATAKNKGDHPKKPGNKDERQEHDKPT